MSSDDEYDDDSDASEERGADGSEYDEDVGIST